MPKGAKDGILKGCKFRAPAEGYDRAQPSAAARSFRKHQGAGNSRVELTSADVWSVTSYTELYRDGHASERWNMLHPPRRPRAA
jgi:pyruvate dehydrogenase E1 component